MYKSAFWPLLKKGVNPLRGIVQKHIARHRFAGDVVGRCERMIDLAVEGLLAERIVAELRDRIISVNRRISASSLLPGTTRLTSPRDCAVAASMGSPVSSISLACFRPMFRTTPTAGVEQNTPMFTPGIANVAVSAATARSHIDTSWHPAAVAMPWTRAITGCGISVSAIIIRLQASNRPC
jgi:hypothetical protein